MKLEKQLFNDYMPIPKAEEKEYYPMSSTQKRTYFICQLNKDGILYNMPECIKLKGRVKVDSLKAALQAVVDRHEILRTEFRIVDGEPVQKIVDNVEVEFDYIRDFITEEKALMHDFVKPFDLSKAPLVRVKLVRKSDNEYVLMLDMHHIVFDSISKAMFIKEFTAWYNDCSLEPLTLQYKDYSEWMRSRDLSAQKAYWEQEYKDEVPVLDMPLDYNRLPEQSYNGSSMDIFLDEELVRKIKKLAKEAGTTEYSVFLSAAMVLLSKYSRQEEIVIGSPVSVRNHKDTEEMLGMFVNILALKGNPEGKKTYFEFLREINEKCLKAYENQEYPFEELVETVVKNRDFSRNPLFDVMLAMEDDEDETLNFEGLEANKIILERDTAKFDFTFGVASIRGKYIVRLGYCTDLFKVETVQRSLVHYQVVLEQIANDPELKLENIEIISEIEREKILREFNDTATKYPYNKTIVDLFEEQVDRTPDNIAVMFGNEKLMYSELNAKANQLAWKLRKIGVKPNDCVVIMAERSIEMIVGICGVLKSGGAYVPISPTLPPERLKYIINDCRPVAILTFNSSIDINIPVIELSKTVKMEGLKDLNHINTADNLAYVIYTSGTTGNPKGVMIEHHSLLNHIYNGFERLYRGEIGTTALFTDCSFDFAVPIIFIPLAFGGSIIIFNDVNETISYLKMGHSLSLVKMTPSHLRAISMENVNNLEVKDIVFGGETFSSDHFRKVREIFKSDTVIHNDYGPTEATVFATETIITSEDSISIGKPSANTQIYILNGMNLCGIGVPGELCIAGEGVARGYLNREELNAQKFIKNPYGTGFLYRTGDLAKWLPDGMIDFLGRIDDQLKIRGFRIEAKEIENVILNVDKIINCAVTVQQDYDGYPTLCAYVVSEDIISSDDIKKILAQVLPDYMIPTWIMFVAEIKLTKNGKIDRKALPNIVKKSEKEYVEPRNETEKIICEIFIDILGVEKVGINDSFFDLGGHSLRATRLINQIESLLGRRIGLKEIFFNQTAEKLAELIGAGQSKNYTPIPRAEEKKYYPMSSTQKRTYFICQLDKDGILYNMPECIKLKGDVKVNSFKAALQEMVDRHEILRTEFHIMEGEPVQKIVENVEVEFDYIKDFITEEKALMHDFVRPFDLSKAPLVRAKLVKKSGDGYFLMIDMHHIVSDGMSKVTFIKEFTALYNGCSLEPLTLQYKDYSEWMRSRDLSAQKVYWEQEYSEGIPVLDIPLDYNRLPEQTYNGSSTDIFLDKELVKKIKELAKETGTTEYPIFLSAAMVLLSKYSRQEEIVIGSPVSARTHKDTEEMLGMFVNTLVLKGNPEGKKTYSEFLKEINEKYLKAYENQEYPFEELVEAVVKNRDFSRNPLFDVMLTLQNNEEKVLNFKGIEAHKVILESKTSKFDLEFEIVGRNNKYAVSLEYCTDLFRTETAQRILAHYEVILEQIVNSPNAKIEDIEVISRTEREKILLEFNNTTVDYPYDKTIVDLFEEQVERTPDNIAVIFGDEKITYTKLNEYSNKLARFLRNKGVQNNEYVVLIANRSIELMMGIFGILKAGGIYVPVNPDYPSERIQYIIDDCNPSVVLTSSKELIDFEIEGLIVDLYKNNWHGEDGNNLEVLINPNNYSHCFYTSGTTGRPKGAINTHGGLINRILWTQRHYPIGQGDTLLQKTTITFDDSLCELLWWSITGARLAMLENDGEKDPLSMCKAIKRYNVNVVYFVPTVLNYFLNILDKEQLYSYINSLRNIFVSGEELKLETVKHCFKVMERAGIRPQIVNTYGPTEASIDVTYFECNEHQEKILIGKPMDNTTAYILDGNHLCGIGVPGELYIGGICVGSGYLNRPDLTEISFIDNPFGSGKLYRTGDLSRWKSDGNIDFMGRIDEQVKIRGQRIEIEEVESSFRKVVGINDCAVIAKADEAGDKALYAYIVSKEEINVSQIRDMLRETLPEYMIPGYIARIEAIPVTLNGKLDKKALPEIKGKSEKDYIAPRNETEKVICEVFSDILGVESVGINDNFFELGGHSLSAFRLVNQIESLLGYRIALKEIFSNSTAEKLAELIGAGHSKNYTPIPKAEEKEYYPMSSTQKRTYFICQLDKDGILYNMPECIKLKGKVKINSLKAALQAMVDRHEIFRTEFHIMNGEPIQKIIENVEVEFDYVEDIIAEVKGLIHDFVRPFDLSKAPLIRAKLVKKLDDEYVLMLDMHHIVSDGISMVTFIKEFTAWYNGCSLEPLTLQYKDYSEWMRSRDLSTQKAYWEQEYKDDVPVLNMPLDYNRPSEQSYNGSSMDIFLDEELVRKIKKLAKKAGTTEYPVFLSAAMVLLSKYSRQEEIVIGSPVSARNHKDTEEMLGMFVNTLALKGNPEGKKTYSEFLKEINEKCLRAYENQEYPFEELVETVVKNRDFSRNPLFDVMLAMEDDEDETLNFEGLEANKIILERDTAKFDFTFGVASIRGKYIVRLGYCTDLFKVETVQRSLVHYQVVLEQIANDPELKLENIEIISEIEREKILLEFNDTATKYPCNKTIVDLFEEQVDRTPDNLAVVFGNEKLMYSELNAKANQLAWKLREVGVKPNDCVVIMAKRSIEMVVAVLGIIKAGGAYVPIDPAYPKDRISYILKDCSPKAILIYHTNIETELPIINMAIPEVWYGNKNNPDRINDVNDIAYLIYTSGTTGTPKGVMLEHGNVANLREIAKYDFEFKDKDKVLLFANISFDASAGELFMGILTGASIYLLEEEKATDPEFINEYIKKETINILPFPPQFASDVKYEKANFFLTAGSEAKRETVEYAVQRSDYINCYGPTETCVTSTFWKLKKGETVPEKITIGKPNRNTQIYIMNGKTLCGIGMPGELCIAGDGVARGYLNLPELTSEKFVNNPFGEGKIYCSGDLARWLPDGNIEFMGRIDEQVKIRGFRIELGEIESVLRKISGINDCAVIAKADEFGDKALYAYIVSKEEISVLQIKGTLRETLPEYMIPGYITRIEAIPVTANGKLDKKALPEIKGKRERDYIAPRNETEKVICEVFSDVLGVESVGINDSFFELGGHSLSAFRLVNQIESLLEYRIALKEIFSNSTAEKLAELVGAGQLKNYTPIPKAEEKEYYPMSSTQKRTYFICQLDKDGILYNMSECIKLKGKVKINLLKAALQAMVDRHEIFRTEFHIIDGEPIQKIIKNVEVEFDYDVNDAMEEKKLMYDFVRQFDLSKAPLVRAKLVKKSDDEYVLMLDMHHIVSDGISMITFIKEFTALYNGCSLEPLTLQYKDYSEWMRSRDLSAQKAYWEQEYSEEIPVLDMPLDYNRLPEQSYNGASTDIFLDAELVEKIKKLAKKSGTTEYPVFLSAAMVLLSKYSRQEEIVIGSPVSARTHKDTEEMLGMFVNTLALKGNLGGKKTYYEFLKEINEKCLKAYENQEYPFEELVEAVVKNRDFSRNPLFDVMLAIENDEDEMLNFEGMEANKIILESDTSKFDFTFGIASIRGKYIIRLEYCTDLFKAETAQRILVHYKVVLEQIVNSPNIKLENIEIISEIEREKILLEFNDTATEYPRNKTIVDLFEEQVHRTPDNIAVVFGNEKLMYSELNAKVNQLAWKLREVGVKPNDCVIIMAERSIEMVVAVLGIIKAGGAYVPIDPAYPKDRISYILEDCSPKAVLTYHAGIETERLVINIERPEAWNWNKENPVHVNNANDIAYLIYTSGTTGTPKGVMLEHINVVNLYEIAKYDFETTEEDGILLFANISFDASAGELLMGILTGAIIYVLEEDKVTDPEFINEYIKKEAINILPFPPQFASDVKYEKAKFFLTAGSEAKREIVEYAAQRSDYINCYGPTETCVTSTFWKLKKGETVPEKITIGKPNRNTQIYIMNGKMLCGIGMPGELCIAGDGVARGYLNRPGLTAEKFVDNPYGRGKMYRSGDLGRWMPDGNIEFMGRIDEQIKIRGFRIEPGEVESALKKLEGINDCAVIAKADEAIDKALYAYIVSTEEISVSQIRDTLRETLPEYMIPGYIARIEAIPVTANGKLDKKALPEIKVKSEKDYIAPRNETEKVICEVFSDVLGVESVGANDSFFELGGDSIKALRVVSNIRERGFDSNIRIILTERTPENIALCVKVAQENYSEQGEITGEVKLTPIMREFLNSGIKNINHYNQSVILKNNNFDAENVTIALQKIVEYHDILRGVYNGKTIVIRGSQEANLFNLEEFNILMSNEDEKQEFIKEKGNLIQSGMSIYKGPLIKAAIFHGVYESYLLIAIHHLVVDGVSMRIIVDDFICSYAQIWMKKEIMLPAKTNSFKQWSECLEKYSMSKKLQDEMAYWKQIEISSIEGTFSPDRSGNVQINDFQFEIDSLTTTKLLHHSTKAYSTEINDLLLTALGMAFYKETGQKKLTINLEGHGRENICDELLIDRTVGWFTSIYPIILSIGNNISDNIIKIKNMLHQIPNKGLGYGLLKYSTDTALKGVKGIIFNYLGNFEESRVRISQSEISLSDYPRGNEVAVENLDNVTISFNGILYNQQLQFVITYNNGLYSTDIIKRIADNYIGALTEIVEHCTNIAETVRTFSDLSLYGFSEDDLYDKKIIVDKNIEKAYPLTPLQEGMLYVQDSDQNKGNYFLQTTIRYHGYTELKTVRDAMELLAVKHEVLRTRIEEHRAKKPFQTILSDMVLECVEIDLRDNPMADAAIEEIKKCDIDRGFDFQTDSLIRMAVVRVLDNETKLIMSVHHIIMDGWCNALIFGDFAEYISRLTNGETKGSIANEIKQEKSASYAEYIGWRNLQNNSDALEYWKGFLEDYDGLVVVPESMDKDNINQFSCQIIKEIPENVSMAAIKYGVTVNVISEAALGILLQQYNWTNDVVFSKVVSGRNADIVGIEKIAGLFINTIVQRIKTEPKTKIRDFLKKLNFESAESSKYDFIGLSEILSIAGLNSKQAEILYLFQNYYVDEEKLLKQLGSTQDANIFDIESSREQVHYGISFAAGESPTGGLMYAIMYQPEKYSKRDINKLLDQLEKIIIQLINFPDAKIEDIEVITESEKEKILLEFNNTATEYPCDRTIADLFEEQVMHTPDNISVVFGSEKLTYRELNEKVNQLAWKLREMGIKPNDYAAIMAERSIEMVVAVLGIIKAGGAYVPIDPTYPMDRINYILKDCSPKAILVYHTNIETELPIINMAIPEVWYGNKNNPDRINDVNDIAYLIYTSGTTGTPKGVMLEHINVVNLYEIAKYDFETTEEDGILLFANISFDASAGELLMGILTGATIYVLEEDKVTDPEFINEYIKKESINILPFPPQFASDVKYEKAKFFLTAGSEAKRETVEYAVQRSDYINCYGPTETCVTSTFWKLKKGETVPEKITIGKPNRNTQIYIMNGNTLCGVGMPGELCIAGDGVAKGYLNRPDLTAEKFVDNPYGKGRMYKSGDLGRWLSDGNIEFLGRIDEQVKIRGFRIELGEVESALKKLEGINDGVVIAKADEFGDKALYAYVVSNEEISVSQIRNTLKETLPEYMIPGYIAQIEKIPVTASGKLDKKALPEIRGKRERDYIAPRNETEKIICEIFSNVLSVGKIGVNDNFFELGGDSIKAIQVVSIARNKGLQFGVRDLLMYKTVEEVACHIDCSISQLFSYYTDDTELGKSIEVEPDKEMCLELKKVIKKYDNNIEGLDRSEHKASLRSLDFINDKYDRINVYGIKINSEFNMEGIIAAINKVICEQPALRTSYKKLTRKMVVYHYDKKWEIPVFKFEKEGLIEVFKNSMLSVKNDSLFLGEKKSLAKILITTSPENGKEVHLLVHHATWDGESCVIWYNRLLHYLNNPESIPTEINTAVISVDNLYRKKFYMEFWDRYEPILKNAKKEMIKYDSGNIGILKKYTILNKNSELLTNPMIVCIRILRILCERIFGNAFSKLPVILLHNGRNESNKNSLGLYLDYIPTFLDISKIDNDQNNEFLDIIAQMKENEFNTAEFFHYIGAKSLEPFEKFMPILNIAFGFDIINWEGADYEDIKIENVEDAPLSLDIQAQKNVVSIYVTGPINMKNVIVETIDANVLEINKFGNNINWN